MKLRIFLSIAVISVTISGCVRVESVAEPTAGDVKKTQGVCTEPGGISITIERDVSRSYCVRGFDGTSWQLLESVAKIRGTDDYPDSFICRIDGWPDAADNDCTSSASNFGYWNYYLADSTGWQVANEGAATHIPTCGSAEAWKWISGPWTEKVELPAESPEVFSCED